MAKRLCFFQELTESLYPMQVLIDYKVFLSNLG